MMWFKMIKNEPKEKVFELKGLEYYEIVHCNQKSNGLWEIKKIGQDEDEPLIIEVPEYELNSVLEWIKGDAQGDYIEDTHNVGFRRLAAAKDFELWELETNKLKGSLIVLDLGFKKLLYILAPKGWAAIITPIVRIIKHKLFPNHDVPLELIVHYGEAQESSAIIPSSYWQAVEQNEED